MKVINGFDLSLIIKYTKMSNIVDLLYGPGSHEKIAKTNLLIIGVGGIGC